MHDGEHAVSTDAIFRLVHATIITLGYGAILIVYMIYGPADANRALDALLGGLSSGYLIVLNSIYGSKVA
jgi:hypothetical protein